MYFRLPEKNVKPCSHLNLSPSMSSALRLNTGIKQTYLKLAKNLNEKSGFLTVKLCWEYKTLKNVVIHTRTAGVNIFVCFESFIWANSLV